MGTWLTNSKIRLGLSALAVFSTMACTGVNAPVNSSNGAVETTAASFSAARIKADVTFLADDLLRGRDTGSEGYRLAANYVAAEYARLGLRPAGDGSSYFQEVPFQTAMINQESAVLTVKVNGTETALNLGDDFYMGGSVKNKSGEATGPVVFIGYGIYAPDFGHDDLAGLDLTGKIVLMVSGAPDSFNTEIRAHYGSSATKTEILLKRGVVATLTVNSQANEKRRPFKSYKRFLGRKNFDWVMPAALAAETPRLLASASVSSDVAAKMFAGADVTFSSAMAAVEAGKYASTALKTEITMKRESILSDTFYSPNVLGVLEGSDPKLKNEYVVMSAHLDHIGISEHAKGDDKINNGALDNAAGISVMLEVARAYVAADIKPRRSIIFAAVAAEEKGLLGAGYFAQYPTVDKKAMVADVNLDMPILLYDFTDVVAFGADRSSLGPITAAAVGKIGVSLGPDPMPEEGIFTRSDHYRFVQQGIPSVFLVTGWGEDTNGKDGGKIFMEFLGKTYHSPADQIDQDIDYDAGAKFAYVNWLITSAIANDNDRPTWNEGDFFGKTFAKK